jgi:hypothetical protein
MRGAIRLLPSTPSWHSAQLKKCTDNFTFYLVKNIYVCIYVCMYVYMIYVASRYR